MRIRSIKPEFWRSDDIAALPLSARLLFVGLWSYVDDNGVGSDKLASIAADLFAPDLEVDPTETFRRVSVDTTRLETGGLIVRYAAGGKPLLYITNWEKHQVVKNPSLGHKYPLPSGDLIDAAATLRRPYGDPTETLGTGAGEQGSRGAGEQGSRGAGEQGSKSPAVIHPPGPPIEDIFSDVWEHWPKKVQRKAAFESFKRAARKRAVNLLAVDILEFGDAYAATTERQYVPALAAWINGERWSDEKPRARRVPDGRLTPEERARQTLALANNFKEIE